MGRLFRRVVRNVRGPRRVSRASTVRSADGKQYRVVAVDEAEATEFADPPRKWGRVCAMAGAWAVALMLGAWVAPGFAASGNPENEDSRDQGATDAEGAALRYLGNASKEDLDRASAALCSDASPEVTPEELAGYRTSIGESNDGVEDIEVSTKPVIGSNGLIFAAEIKYVTGKEPVFRDFTVTVEQEGDYFCVADATSSQQDEPSTDATTVAPDPVAVANSFITTIVGNRDSATATDMQCEPYKGYTARDLDAAVEAWAERYGWRTGSSLGAVQVESAETGVTMFNVGVKLEGDGAVEEYEFLVGVQGDCVASVAGGEGLI
jgi:hypothetical protein